VPVAVHALKDVPLFRDLPGKSVDRIARHATPASYRAGEVIFHEGDEATGFFIIASGLVAISVGGSELAQLGSGGFFGEMALLDQHRRSATVQALLDTECLTISRLDFIADLHNNPDTALQLLAALSRRIRDLDQRIRHLESSIPSEWLA
jgi:CRP-like cAMP-binding protein